MKLSVCSWSLHREIPKKVSLLEFPAIVKNRFGLDGVELCQSHFASVEQDYLDEMVAVLEKTGTTATNIPVDVGHVGQPDPAKRVEELKIMKGWFSIAKYIGSPSIRVNTGGGEDEATMQRVIEGYKELVEEAERTGIKLLIENHGGVSADPDNVVRIIEAVDSEWLGTCPDFGNFAPEVRYDGLEETVPYAPIAHAKMYEFDENGEETTIDVARCMRIFEAAGFDGVLSVEFEGPGDEYEGVEKTIALLKRYGA